VPSPSVAAESHFTATASAVSDWEDVLLWYLLWLYETLGGDPATLQGQTPTQAMGTVNAYYTKHGISGLSVGRRSEFLTNIPVLWQHLRGAPSGYAGSTLTEFSGAVRAMYADAGGDPNTLL
jgi:hypothetical protein